MFVVHLITTLFVDIFIFQDKKNHVERFDRLHDFLAQSHLILRLPKQLSVAARDKEVRFLFLKFVRCS